MCPPEKRRMMDCPYYDENVSVCDDGECGCYECQRQIEKCKENKKNG